MKQLDLYRTESDKSNENFIDDFSRIAHENGFIIINNDKMNMRQSFKHHGIEMDEGFDLHMVQICKPEKAAKSLSSNPERSILMPKFLMTFTENKKTQIRFLRFNEEDITSVVVDDVFPRSLAETYDRIVTMIEDAI